MTTVRFTPGLDEHVVRFAYDPAVVEAIKEIVPSYARSWRPATRTWLIDPNWPRSSRTLSAHTGTPSPASTTTIAAIAR